ncbi:MAG: DUF4349 domain-containing protein [Clostridia bacterium]|nr:DUF4349 domain-containing protein [Clostridia bacterium]
MVKRILSLLMVLVLIGSVMVGCGAKSSSTKSEAPMAKAAPQAMDKDSGIDNFADKAEAKREEAAPAASKADTKMKNSESEKSATGFTGSGAASQTVSNAILAQRKIIRNANISVEVENFEKSYGQIKSLISAFGFIQESNIKKEKIYNEGKEKLITRGVIVVRVDKNKFENVLSDIKGLGLLLDESIKSDDVTDQFFDVESRLRLLKYEESRLEEYLKKINDPDTIFKTESRLTDIRHEIEGLTGTLKKWSDLVELSTITINMVEKGFDSNVPTAQTKSYWGRLSGSFLGSIKGVATFFGEFLIVLVQSLPVLIVLGLIVWGGIVIYRKYLRRNRFYDNNKTNKDDGIQS